MVVFGDYGILKRIPFGYNTFEAYFNLCSPYNDGIILNAMVPYIDYEGRDFDAAYANFLMNDINAFRQLMSIVISVYEGKNVFIGVYIDSDYKLEVMESLIKFLQQRYGILASTLFDVDDYFSLEEHQISMTGIMNIDIDKERYYESLSMETINQLASQCLAEEVKQYGK